MSKTIVHLGLDPAKISGWDVAQPRMGFFTDTSLCIGCKACEVACKEWNEIPEDGLDWLGISYDNTGSLGASSWRHVAFIEQAVPGGRTDTPSSASALDGSDLRWLMSSDVCKHCTEAGCLDVCPTGSLFRTEFGTVVVQDDICNGCGYCVAACPFGVIERRTGSHGTKNVGLAQKCTLCYDRLVSGMTPACAQACPTESIQFGNLSELRSRARRRVEKLQLDGNRAARLYGDDPNDGIGGAGAMFLLLDQPEVYGLPPNPVVATRELGQMWKQAGIAALTFLIGAAAASIER
ncbi:MAG: 4Fe-4S dicluster domain-containing protein [Actinomycetota bacterium]|nr:MAG: 4Fe-4S dicluster domain-containing protein [Actinomycetota bacterium]